ncbi:MAG: hypothetical protein M1820_006504 [Bogoriella megaspora]|nr:MAG: hypothetical protein M1820_006504 [Bogoriella megaspora]
MGPDELAAYNDLVETIREKEYPMLTNGGPYLDHAGTTLYSKLLMDKFYSDMTSNLYGNPHSASPSSLRSTERIDAIRLKALDWFHADPDNFDLVFVANATSAIKLVGESLKDAFGSFEYAYHMSSHTSLMGLREHAANSLCFSDVEEVDLWTASKLLSKGTSRNSTPSLIAYPTQSNMDGSRLPLSWLTDIYQLQNNEPCSFFTLLDAASFAATSPLDLSNPSVAPDFTAISFNKLFGFPDLGALIIKKETADVFRHRMYFGGGTVDMVVCGKETWHAKKETLHEALEDGTPPIHSILALDAAMESHLALFGSMRQISRHTNNLARSMAIALDGIRHGNGMPVCQIYGWTRNERDADLGLSSHGPIVAFNIKTSSGGWVANTTVEQLAANLGIHLRTGSVCNPGGIADALDLKPYEMKENFSAGQRCGNGKDIMNGKPTGVIRISFGAMSTMSDVEYFIEELIKKYFVDRSATDSSLNVPVQKSVARFRVTALTVYPIKSCGGHKVEPGRPWRITEHGLAWDREWCVVHQGTKEALSQKRHPTLATIRTEIDETVGVLRITSAKNTSVRISVPLSRDPRHYFEESELMDDRLGSVCSRATLLEVYRSAKIATFFTSIVNVPCTLARSGPSRVQETKYAETTTSGPLYNRAKTSTKSRSLANEAPLLIISQSSVDELNKAIMQKGGNPASAEVFRANIVVSNQDEVDTREAPYAEDYFTYMRIGCRQFFKIIGPCMRCQVVCVNQQTGQKSKEPLNTLAQTRKGKNGRIEFGSHAVLDSTKGGTGNEPWRQNPTIMVGDEVVGYGSEDMI